MPIEVATPKWRLWILGAMVLIAMAVLITPFSPFRWRYPHLEIRACFSDVQGMRQGAEVRFAGVQIGYVRHIQAHPEDKQCPAAIEMVIQAGYELKLPRDSVASVQTAGVLGASFVDIDARDASGPAIENHGTLQSRETHLPSIDDVVNGIPKVAGNCPCKDDKDGIKQATGTH